MIARVWHGRTPESKSDEYFDYLMKTGVNDCRSTEGNRGVSMLRRVNDGQAEFVFISLWDSLDAIRQFAGDDVQKAVYYPEDPNFLLELEPDVTHYEVLVKPES